MEQEPGKKRKKRNAVISGIFFVAFLACVIWIIVYFVNLKKADNELSQLKESYVTEQTQEEASTDADDEAAVSEKGEDGETAEPQTDGRVQLSLDGYTDAKKDIDFDALKEENADIYSWITIPGTVIDYPIVQREDELDYYLNHNLDGSTGYPGCIYTQNLNSTDWMDNNTVIYGHNMKNGSMFAGLHSYRDPEFFEEYPYVYIYTETETRVYQIFAAYEVTDAHLLLTYDTENKDSFGWYLQGIMDNEETLSDHYNKSLELNSDDKIISLETCISSKPTMRYLVQAVLVARAENE